MLYQKGVNSVNVPPWLPLERRFLEIMGMGSFKLKIGAYTGWVKLRIRSVSAIVQSNMVEFGQIW